jgi:hypothetical protein
MSHGCPQRLNAISKGAKLPPTTLEEDKANNKGSKKNKITSHFAPAEKFDNQILNQMITLWLLRQALPWSRIEDNALRASFFYCQAAAHLFKRKWAANSARLAYLEFQEAMIHRLKVSNIS